MLLYNINKMVYGQIYKIECNITGAVYIGYDSSNIEFKYLRGKSN